MAPDVAENLSASSRLDKPRLEVLGDETVALRQLNEAVVGLTHSSDVAADGVRPVLTRHATGRWVHLGQVDLDGCAVLRSNYAVAGRALPRDVHIHVFSGVVLHLGFDVLPYIA